MVREKITNEAQHKASGQDVVAICKEASKLLRAHGKLYFCTLQYQLLLPCLAVELGLGIALARYLIGTFSAARSLHPSLDYVIMGPWNMFNRPELMFNDRDIWFNLCCVGLSLVRAIWSSPLTYATGLSCVNGDDPTRSNCLRAIPRFWNRVTTTMAAFFVLLYVGFYTLGPLVFFPCELASLDLLHVRQIFLVTHIVVGLWFATVFMLVPVVPVLDGEGGWDAVWKGWKLLQGKRLVGIGVLLLSNLPLSLISVFLSGALDTQVAADPWTFKALLLGLTQIAFASVTLPWLYACQVVMYTSCKDYHSESFTAIVQLDDGRNVTEYMQINT